MDIARASIKRRLVVLFICVVMAVAGIAAYFEIGKLEDPSFTIKTAVISAAYPGASSYEVEQEVTARIEDAVQAMGEVKRIKSNSYPNMATIYVDIKDEYTSKELPQIWDKLRQKVNDAQINMPSGCVININNDYGDVYGQYYALVGDGYTMKELWDYADFLKKNLVLVPGVASVKILGEQTECIYIEFTASRLAAIGLSPETVINILNQQNSLSAVGQAELGDRYIRISPTGAIFNVEDIDDLIIGGSGGNLTRLRDIASVRRGYVENQSLKMKFNGRPALGLGISCVEGGNVVTMGNAVKARLKELEEFRPVGIELNEIYMQSDQVAKSVNDFIINLIESLAIVVGVLLIFMGLRSGLIIGAVLLLTVAGTLAIMNASGIFLQSVSLAALIIALGSLVDNAIVVTEGMLVGVERGMTLEDAASDTVNGSVWAMLGGTIIAVLAFAPIGLSPDSTGEFCRSLFQVIGISMILSWVTAVTITPVFGKIGLKVKVIDASNSNQEDPYDKFLFRAYKAFLKGCLKYKYITLLATIGLFAGALWLLTQLDMSFFPDADSVYFTADIYSDEGTSINEQERRADRLVNYLIAKPEVKQISEFVGGGGLRFMLTYSPPEANTAYAQLLVELKNSENARKVFLDAQRYIDEEMPEMSGVCKMFSKGSGGGPKIEARFYGWETDALRALAEQARQILEDDPAHNFVRTNWRSRVEVLRPKILKDQMQNLGLTRPAINRAILEATGGAAVGAFRDGDKSLEIKAAFTPEERNNVELMRSLPIWAPASNTSVPLGSLFSAFETVYEDNIIIHRNRERVITIEADTKLGENANAMLSRVESKIKNIKLPMGYRFEWGGEYESSNDAMGGMQKLFLPVIVLMFMIIVFLFNGFKQPIIIFAAVPLILIGVALGLYIADMSLSFLAIVGVLSLVGMLVKNSIVLLDQVSADFDAGHDKYNAIVDDAVSRLRPVAMSALTTVLGMIPLIWDVLFGSMAVTIMAGLTVSTVLTLIFIPVLTAIFYKVEPHD